MKEIGIIASHGCWGFSVMASQDVFHLANLLRQRLGQAPFYRTSLTSSDGQPVRCANGSVINADKSLADAHPDVCLLPAIAGPHLPSHPTAEHQPLRTWLADWQAQGRPLISLSTAAYWLAISDAPCEQPLATHWAFVPWLEQHCPGYTFCAHDSFMQHGQTYTTGSLEGGFAAMLEMIRIDLGEHFAQLCSAHLLIADPQRLNPALPGYRNHQDARVLAMQTWLETHYAESITLADLAARFLLSERTLKRHFQAATGISANAYLQAVRISRAKTLLLTSSDNVQHIAHQVGYHNVSFFIRLFKQHTGFTPAQWKASGPTGRVI